MVVGTVVTVDDEFGVFDLAVVVLDRPSAPSVLVVERFDDARSDPASTPQAPALTSRPARVIADMEVRTRWAADIGTSQHTLLPCP